MVKRKNNSIAYFVPPQKCCGCLACIDLCPKSCIDKSQDSKGFLTVRVNKELCINCGKCRTVCPSLNHIFFDSQQSVRSLRGSYNIRISSASGGAFQIIARDLLLKGFKVWGAAFNNKNQLMHIKVDSLNRLPVLLKSKYLQSDMEGVYLQIKDSLDKGDQVLYSGLPCQCSALRNFLKCDYDNLYVLDLICHGVPSQSLFNKYIAWEEKRLSGQIVSFEFRYKDNKSKDAHLWKIKYKKGNEVRQTKGLHFESPFYFGFQKYLTLRDSCYSCSFAQSKRVGDLTLGDCWGEKKSANKGLSAIIINSKKGMALYNNMIPHLVVDEEYSLDKLIQYNGNLSNPTKEPKSREKFFSDLNKKDFSFVVEKYLKPKKYYAFKLYYSFPHWTRSIVKLFFKKMKYE